MDEVDIRKAVLKISETNFEYHTQVNTLTISMIDLDESRFEKVMSTCILRFGLENTMIEVVYPFLKKIGIMWQTGSITPCHEHFISNLIRQKIIVAIDAQINPDNEKSKKFLLFLPEQELHEIGLLFASYLIKARNNKVIYLGSSVPFDDLREVYHIHKPEYLLTLITSTTKGEIINAYLKKLADEFPKATIMVSFHDFIGKPDQFPENVKILKTLNDLIKYLESDEKFKDNYNFINTPRKQ
jgi:MerR family transcriptional regulator, light-induced transcriptional regulator